MKRIWIRLYTNVPHNHKVQRLPGGLFKFWINCLCLRGSEGGSRLPPEDDLGWSLKLSAKRVTDYLIRLERCGLVHHDNDGWEMHDFLEHQYDSDISTERVKRFRNAQRAAAETHQSRAEADTEAEQKQSSSTEGVLNRAAAAAAAAASPSPKTNGQPAPEPRALTVDEAVEEALHELASEGVDLPQKTVLNEYGRASTNPAWERMRDAIRRADARIRKSRKPVAYVKGIILSELKGA